MGEAWAGHGGWAQGALRVGAGIGIGSKYRRGEGERGETSPHSSALEHPFKPSPSLLRGRVFCPRGHGASLAAVQARRARLLNPLFRVLYLVCPEHAAASAATLADRQTSSPLRLVLAWEVQVPPFRRMPEGAKREKESQTLWLKYAAPLLRSPKAPAGVVMAKDGAGESPGGCSGTPLAKPPPGREEPRPSGGSASPGLPHTPGPRDAVAPGKLIQCCGAL